MMYEEERGRPHGGEDFQDVPAAGSEKEERPDKQRHPDKQGLPDKPRTADYAQGESFGSGDRTDPFDPFSHLFGDPQDVAFARKEARRRAAELIRRMRRRRVTASEERRETLRRIRREGRITAVDLRRRTSEVIAALDRNEELLISHRNRWVGVITPISLIQDTGDAPPITSSRYFGFARWAPRLRRKRDWPGYTTRVGSVDSVDSSVDRADGWADGEDDPDGPIRSAGGVADRRAGSRGSGGQGSGGHGESQAGRAGDGPGDQHGDQPGDRPGDEPMAPCPV